MQAFLRVSAASILDARSALLRREERAQRETSQSYRQIQMNPILKSALHVSNDFHASLLSTVASSSPSSKMLYASAHWKDVLSVTRFSVMPGRQGVVYCDLNQTLLPAFDRTPVVARIDHRF